MFARIGLSDGATTPFEGGWQVGVLFDSVLAKRPQSQLSFGINRGDLSHGFREAVTSPGINRAKAETGLEMAIADQLTPNLRIQPDVQCVLNSGGVVSAKPAIVIGLRIVLTVNNAIGR